MIEVFRENIPSCACLDISIWLFRRWYSYYPQIFIHALTYATES